MGKAVWPRGWTAPILAARPFGRRGGKPQRTRLSPVFVIALLTAICDRLRPRLGRSLAWLLAAIACAGQWGCVQRRLTIRSNPPGALVYVDDYPVGTTPCSTSFVYYGTRKVRVVLSGYETLTVMQPIPTPWYEYPVLDFVSENLLPGEIRDERVVDYQLKPQMIVPSQQLLGRAENLRHGAARPQMPLPSSQTPSFGAPLGTTPRPVSPPPTSRPGGPFNY